MRSRFWDFSLFKFYIIIAIYIWTGNKWNQFWPSQLCFFHDSNLSALRLTKKLFSILFSPPVLFEEGQWASIWVGFWQSQFTHQNCTDTRSCEWLMQMPSQLGGAMGITVTSWNHAAMTETHDWPTGCLMNSHAPRKMLEFSVMCDFSTWFEDPPSHFLFLSLSIETLQPP